MTKPTDRVYEMLDGDQLNWLLAEEDGILNLFQDMYTPPRNKNEAMVHSVLLDKGIGVLRKGWPDFIAFSQNDLFAVEVKGPGDYLRPSQVLVNSLLARAGIDVYIAQRNSRDSDFWFEAVGGSKHWTDR